MAVPNRHTMTGKPHRLQLHSCSRSWPGIFARTAFSHLVGSAAGSVAGSVSGSVASSVTGSVAGFSIARISTAVCLPLDIIPQHPAIRAFLFTSARHGPIPVSALSPLVEKRLESRHSMLPAGFRLASRATLYGHHSGSSFLLAFRFAIRLHRYGPPLALTVLTLHFLADHSGYFCTTSIQYRRA